MSDRTRLIQRVAARNPVPDPDQPPIGTLDREELRPVLMRRESEVQTQERTKPDGIEPPRRQGWLLAAAAFAVVLVVGVVMTFTDSDPTSTEPPAASTTSTESPTTTAAPATTAAPPTTTATATVVPGDLAVAEQLVAAIYSNDIATIEALANPNARLDFVTYFAGFIGVIDVSYGIEILDAVCAPSAVGNIVECRVHYVDDTARAAGVESLTETWQFGFAGGLPQTFRHELPVDDPIVPVLVAMSVQHPEWFEPGGPCEGAWEDGDPATCAPVWTEFIINWFAENG